MSVVYWIKAPHHEDIFSEGYVGVSATTAEFRFKRHLKDAYEIGEYPIHKAIKKYGDNLQLITILEGSQDYCYQIEHALRPLPNIGWNIIVGGSSSPMQGRKHSKQSAKLLSEINSGNNNPFYGRQHSEDFKKSQSNRMSNLPPWRSNRSIKKVWLIADAVYAYYRDNPKHGIYRLSKAFDVPVMSLQKMLDKLRNGWNPENDSDWLNFVAEHKYKEVTDG